MAFLFRLIGFLNHEKLWWPLGGIIVFTVVLWRHRDPQSASILLGGSALAFVGPYFFRQAVIRRYGKTKAALVFGAAVLAVLVLATRLFGDGPSGELSFGVYSAFCVGVLFWSASDPMFEMMRWLAFPTEWGRLPDEIHLFDRRRLAWPSRRNAVDCCLFRFRFDDKWSYGIVGPLTFALFDQDFDGKSPEEIYAAYAEWYDRAGVGKLIEKTIDREVERQIEKFG